MKNQNTGDGDSMFLKISDDDISKKENSVPKSTGFGTQLISLLTKQLDGKLTYDNSNGTSVSLLFKKTKIA